ncbi:MAG: GntR family transcriptional regulator [Dermabacter sp.]|nr:GntR family transcriptional regulator [Dermabacter sp.]
MTIRRQVLREEVHEMILRKLLEARWEPGARLSIDGLARELSVSPTPVREAMVSLEASGLVEYQSLRGYVVAPRLDAQAIDELIDARLVVETTALSRAFAAGETFRADLRDAFDAHVDLLRAFEEGEAPDYELIRAHYQADWEFHQVFIAHADNRYFDRIMGVLRPLSHRMRQTWRGDEGAIGFDALDALREHRIILDRVLDRNHDGALEALREHLAAVRFRSMQAPEAHE